MNTEEDYQPYGHDWETEMMKWNKRHLVDWVRRLLTSQEQDYLESITDQLKQRDETIVDLTLQLQVANTSGQFLDEQVKELKEALRDVMIIIENSPELWLIESQWNIINKARKLLTE